MDWNPFLAKTDAAAARGTVEKLQNIEWQTRAAPPTGFENRLGDALERVFAEGAESLQEVVQQLNAGGSRDAAGLPWTEASFQETMRRLGE
ncbi:MAG TPA: recombinase-like helix-turn-helix domain-containing protein [Burkholderiales bacterium]